METGPMFQVILILVQLVTFGKCRADQPKFMFIREDIEKIRLSCHGKEEIIAGVVKWRFETNRELIIQRTSDGIITKGGNYTVRSKLEDNNDLTLYAIRKSDSGLYSCHSEGKNGSINETVFTNVIVIPPITEAEETKSTIVVIIMAVNIFLADVNVILLLTHCDTYKKHKDIWSLRLFMLAYHIIYGIVGLIFLLLYIIRPNIDFLYTVGLTCSATNVPPSFILWIDFLVMARRLTKKRSTPSEDAFHEENMMPIIDSPDGLYLLNGDRALRRVDTGNVRNRNEREKAYQRSKGCCGSGTDDNEHNESVELVDGQTGNLGNGRTIDS